MEIRIGDRFETNYKAILECTGTGEIITLICLRSSNHTGGYHINQSYDIPLAPLSLYKYLGNFGKSDNFNNLYNLMNE